MPLEPAPVWATLELLKQETKRNEKKRKITWPKYVFFLLFFRPKGRKEPEDFNSWHYKKQLCFACCVFRGALFSVRNRAKPREPFPYCALLPSLPSPPTTYYSSDQCVGNKQENAFHQEHILVELFISIACLSEKLRP